MKPTLSQTNKKPSNVPGIILLVISFIFIGLTAKSIYSSILARSAGEGSDAGAGVMYRGYWMFSSLTGFIAVLLLCISIPMLSSVKKPSASLLSDEVSRRKYRQKASLLGFLWLLVPCIAVLLYTYAPNLGRLHIFALEPIDLMLIVFGLINTIRYTLWSRAANTVNL
jgi:hypothetical protein